MEFEGFENTCLKRQPTQGCSCKDDCVYATKDEVQCCRNKCSICPDSSAENPDPMKRSPICDCQWDDKNRRSYNTHRPSDDWGGLCSAWVCDFGYSIQEGICEPCAEGTFKQGVNSLRDCEP